MVQTIVSLVGLFVAASLIVVGNDILRPLLSIAGVLVAVAAVLYWLH